MSQNIPNMWIYYTLRDMSIALYAMLIDADKEEVNQILNEKIYEDRVEQLTLLMVAARYGRNKVIQMLLSNFNPDLEKEGNIAFDGSIIEGASALWCAANAGHIDVIKTLVEAGADVNHPTKTNSTPLRAACLQGRLCIVKYLIAHDADINTASTDNNTCLMVAAYKGHVDVVRFLLENGADPDKKALYGSTALHFAAVCGHVEIVKELLQYDAKFFPNDSGMTPIKVAAERTREQVVEFLIKQEITKEEMIEALELLGASFANDETNYDIVKAHYYLHMSMRLRFSDPNKPILKKLMPPIPAYENWSECQNIYELESIEFNNYALHMESLTVRERILGIQNPEVPQAVIYRGAMFASEYRFDRCLELWMHALHLRQNNCISVMRDLQRFAIVFSRMMHLDARPNCQNVVQVLSSAMSELERNKIKLAHPEPRDDPSTILGETDSTMSATLYLLTTVTRLHQYCSNEEKSELNRMVFTLNKKQFTRRDGQTLLHLACNTDTAIRYKYPCPNTIRLLIQCGADVNAMDRERNTPLHVIANYEPTSDFSILQSIIKDLTEAGAHVDCVNTNGKTPLKSAATGSFAETILKTQTKISLKCIAAIAVKQYELEYHGQVPKELESFIELHGRGILERT